MSPTSGTVAVNGQPLYGISDDDRTDLTKPTFWLHFQNFNLLPVLSAVENVELPCCSTVVPQEAREEAHESPRAGRSWATETATGLQNSPVGSSNV